MIRGIVNKFILSFLFIFFINNNCFALEKIGIITDTLLTPVNYYNAYYRTPEFFAQDIRSELLKKNIQVISYTQAQNALKESRMTQRDIESLQGLQQGYNLYYPTLKKIAKNLKVNKLVIITMGMDIQRDFLKNTIWNIANISGMDVVNPTHRVSVYVGFVDVNKEVILWESIYAKNIRNNKMKNLDTAISNNYEGMLRLKEYSKYISPDIAYNVNMKLQNVNYVEPPTVINRENVKQYIKDRHNIGTKKELSEIEREKWDVEKLKEDTKENTIECANNIKTGTKTAYGKLKTNLKKAGNGIKKGFNNFKSKIKPNKKEKNWL